MVSHAQSAVLEQARAIASTHWGIQGEPTRLGGENLNVAFDTAVLKITVEAQADPELESAAMDALAEAQLPVAIPLPSITGELCVPVEIDARHATARMLTRMEGTPWRAQACPADALEVIGRSLANTHEALQIVSLDAARRTHAWDLAQAGQHRASVGYIECPDLRMAADWALQLHDACDLSDCPRGVLHGDFNDENVLLYEGEVSGILDFGDVLEGPMVLDLAIAVAYALQHVNHDLAQVAPLVAAYDAVRPLNADEQQVLFPMVVARLATSVCISAARRATMPDAPESLQSMDGALLALHNSRPLWGERVLCSGCRVHRRPAGDYDTLRQRRESLLCDALSLSYQDPVHMVRGRGAYLIDADGHPYLDLVNNVCHVGHCHPHVARAIADQARRLNTNTRYLHAGVLDLAARLTATMPEPLDTCIFVNSGSEANELALRMVRAATGRDAVAVVEGAYHGNTSNCIAMSPYKFDGPGGRGLADWVHVLPMPDAYRRDDLSVQAMVGASTAVLDAAGDALSACFIESLLSCGGQIPLPEGWLAGVVDHVRSKGGLYVADEVQVGFGRVGDAMWGFQLHDVVPDVVVLGKPMGNGHPIGAVVTTSAIAEAFASTGMEFFSTFGGNPVSCAAASAVLDVIEHEQLQARAAALGGHFRAGLEALMSRHACIGDVRGAGLFLGIEFVQDRSSKAPAADLASQIVNALMPSGVLLSTDGPLHNVVKIKPPLVITRDSIDMVLRLLDRAISAHA
ncbi:MAG: aminotransferase class III-fold pyridoxal phosphate-dependent enzyme [Phycisphaerales bacterium]|nr:aminotransferase class III-fold pyridoxal phosphate-dependent enzyme [Phycisphaerales bacterium]